MEIYSLRIIDNLIIRFFSTSQPINNLNNGFEFVEIQYVMSGHGECVINEKKYPAQSGDIFICAGEDHCNYFSSDGRESVVYDFILPFSQLENSKLNFEDLMDFSGFLLCNSITEKPLEDVFIKLLDSDLTIKKIWSTVQTEYKDKQVGYSAACTNYFMLIIIQVIRICQKEKNTMGKRYIYDIISYIEDNYGKKIGLKELAKITFLCPQYLCNIFKAETGQSIMKYIQDVRLKHICTLLVETDKYFSEIAEELGYSNCNFLRNIFKEKYGMTPSQYRHKYKPRS